MPRTTKATRQVRGWSLAVALMAVGPAAGADHDTEPPACFDAVVSARVLSQTPTPIPSCGDCIVMSWPWIVQLDVDRVLKGRAPEGVVTVLRVQHTYSLASPGGGRWWLRRNTLGGFNVLRPATDASPPRCKDGTPPDQAYFTPANGQTLREVQREGERFYGRRP